MTPNSKPHAAGCPPVRYPGGVRTGSTEHAPIRGLPATWVTFGIAGLDMRAAWTCLIGIILAVALNKCTEYYTGTEFSPVKSLAKSCETGHATNIIQGFAVGYESTRGRGVDHRGGDSRQRVGLCRHQRRRSSPSASPCAASAC